ncbi:hypothetical protein QZH41_003353 [Actinostola sp. cb2023]|nr:hypothetical protein QZH41_003353 [Actinostola sp. cb2023]
MGMYMIRYHSFYPWHTSGEYNHLCNDKDREMLPWVIEFNKFDLYSKSDEVPDMDVLKPYYQGDTVTGSKNDNYVKVIEPDGVSVGNLCFGHTGNHYLALTPTTKKSRRRKNQEMEWWEESEEFCPGISVWRGQPIDLDTSGADVEMAKPSPRSSINTKVNQAKVIDVESSDDEDLSIPTPGFSKVLNDGRNWKKTCPTGWKGHNRTRFADCKGSSKCNFERCPFKVQYGVRNTTQFENNSGGTKVCKGCGEKVEHVPCIARRYLSYGKLKVTVYHIGQHTCPIITKLEKIDNKTVEDIVKNNPNIKPTEVQSAFVLSAFKQQMDWDTVEKEALSTIDKERIANIKRRVKKDIEPFGHNYEAVVSFKQYCDKKDVLYIYKMNDRRGNPDQPSYVFKTSTQKVKIALNMDADGEHFMKSEYCFFDGKRKRCRGFVTLTASVYHPLLRKQIALATMEAEGENTVNIELFWTLFNGALSKVALKPVKFNPIGWCTDMAGANMAGISHVYGDSSRIKSCEFHFKDHRNKKANQLDTESAEEFKELCDELLLSITTAGYETAKNKMDAFINLKEDRHFLNPRLGTLDPRLGTLDPRLGTLDPRPSTKT